MGFSAAKVNALLGLSILKAVNIKLLPTE